MAPKRRLTHLTNLPPALALKVCTCDYQTSYPETVYHPELKIRVHNKCLKPEQYETIYHCVECDELFISYTLHSYDSKERATVSVLATATQRDSNYYGSNKVKEVTCDDCSI